MNDNKELADKLQNISARIQSGTVLSTDRAVILEASDVIKESEHWIQKTKARFFQGMPVHKDGDSGTDAVYCPFCGERIGINNDDYILRLKHCPECGTLLIYD